MTFEQADLPFAEQDEALSPLYRFNLLIELMKKYPDGESGWQELPQLEIRRLGQDPVQAQFFIFLPTESHYSPSILMQIGQEERDDISGALITGLEEKIFIRQAFLEKQSPQYDQNHEEAISNLEKVETMFYAYKNVKDSLQPTE